MTTDTATYADLLKQRAALEQQIDAARKNEIADVLKNVHALVETFALTQADVFPISKPKYKESRGEPKYRDPVSGRTWTGRGRLPDWLRGQDRAEFTIP